MNVIDVIGRLTAAGARFVVVGGVAANAQGSARVTFDLDLCYDAAPDNIRILARVLADWHAYRRGVEPGLPFVMDEKTFRITPVMTLTTDHGDVDLLDRVAGIGAYRDVLAASEEIDGPDGPFRSLTLPGLISA